jgi:uncharacterized membrane protein
VEKKQPPDPARRSAVIYGLAALVSLIGVADAVYLTIEHISGRSVRCTIVSGCSEVLSSRYATVGGYPLAAIGAVAYFTVFSLAILIAFGYSKLKTPLTIVVASMFMTTLWLLYLQAFVIRHFCQFCLLSALVTTVLTVLVIVDRTANRQGAMSARQD